MLQVTYVGTGDSVLPGFFLSESDFYLSVGIGSSCLNFFYIKISPDQRSGKRGEFSPK